MLQLKSVRHAQQSCRTQTERTTFGVRRELYPIAKCIGISQGRLHIRRHAGNCFLLLVRLSALSNSVREWLHQGREIDEQQKAIAGMAANMQPTLAYAYAFGDRIE